VLLEGEDGSAPRDMCCPPFGLQGPLPVALQQCTKLATLWLDENNFGDGGPIPAWLGDMASLKYVDVFGNGFRGAVPASFGKLRKLEKLCVENNDLTGELPVDFGDRALFPELLSLDLSLNPGLTGLVTQTVALFAKGSPGIRYECCGAPCALMEHNGPIGRTCEPSRQCPDRARGDYSGSDPFGRKEGAVTRLQSCLQWQWGSGAGAGAGAAGGSCMAMLPSGEWALAPADQPCGSNKPGACRTASDDTAWLLGNDPARPGGCSADHVAAAPTNGYANEMLMRAAKGQLVWLPVAADGSRLANAENSRIT
jgi:hypothetical protein